MNLQDRRAAARAYKERKTAAGVYAVVCTATGEAWVGASRHVETERNGLWFGLRQGVSRHRALQAAWRTHGEAEFRYEVLDQVPEDTSALRLPDELKKRAALWTARLRAETL